MGRKARGTVHGSIVRWILSRADFFVIAWTPIVLDFGRFPTPLSGHVMLRKQHGDRWAVYVSASHIGGRLDGSTFRTEAAALKKFNAIKKQLLKAKTSKRLDTIFRRYAR